jgi:hypothetical protein
MPGGGGVTFDITTATASFRATLSRKKALPVGAGVLVAVGAAVGGIAVGAGVADTAVGGTDVAVGGAEVGVGVAAGPQAVAIIVSKLRAIIERRFTRLLQPIRCAIYRTAWAGYTVHGVVPEFQTPWLMARRSGCADTTP